MPFLIPVLGTQRKVNPWRLLVSQLSQSGKIQAGVRLCHKEDRCTWKTEQKIVLWFPYVCQNTHMHILTTSHIGKDWVSIADRGFLLIWFSLTWKTHRDLPGSFHSPAPFPSFSLMVPLWRTMVPLGEKLHAYGPMQPSQGCFYDPKKSQWLIRNWCWPCNWPTATPAGGSRRQESLKGCCCSCLGVLFVFVLFCIFVA